MSESTFAERAEKFSNELMREHYEVGAGLKPKMDLVPIYERYADLFAEPTVLERVAALQNLPPPVTATGESRSEGPMRRTDEQVRREIAAKEVRHLADFATSGYIDNVVKQLTESIMNAELQATVLWDDREIPYRNVRSEIVREPDYRRRHDLQSRQVAITVKQNPQRTERIKTQHDLARRLGLASYRAMVEQLNSWDLRGLSKALDPLVEETNSTFDNRLDQYLGNARVPRREADTSDVAYVMRASEFDSFFPAQRLLPAFEKTVRGLGLELDSTPGLHLDTDARPNKSPRAFCAPVRVPSEVYLVIKPIGGQDDYRALFHETGHAEHFTHVDPTLAFAFRYLGEQAISETFAFLFEQITLTPRWLVDVLRVPMREAERYCRFALFNKLWLTRRYTAKLRYELVLHDEGPAGMDTVYRETLGDVLHVAIPPERYLEDVDDGFYVAGYLRAWIFERQLERFFLEQFGEGWYESRDVGGLLKSMWSIGMRDPVDELARTRFGFKGLDPTPLIEELVDI